MTVAPRGFRKQQINPWGATTADFLLYSIATKRKLYLSISIAGVKDQMCLDCCMADDYNEGVKMY